MSRFTNLAIALSLAACEHAAPTSQTQPQFPAQPAAEPVTAPAPTAAEPDPAPRAVETTPDPAPTAPAIAPVAPVAPAATTPTKKLVKQCNPMSRAACRWVEERDERTLPRVIKKGEQVQ